MHVTVEQSGEFARQGCDWVITARVTVRMSDTERWLVDGVRYEALPWFRFRLRLSRLPPGPVPGGWRYEVRDTQWTDDDAGEHPLVCSGARPAWETALRDGQAALRRARLAALDADPSGPVTLPATEAEK